MGPLTKELPESAKTTQDPASHGELAPQGMPTASFDAFGIEIPVQLHGGRAGASAHGAPDTYIEDTCTLIVFPQGAVLRSSTNLAAGQHLLLKNRQTNQDVACRVANLRSYCAGYVEIEFIRPTPGFWGISFPSEASKPSNVQVASPAAAPPKPAAALAPVASATRVSKTNTPLPGAASSKDELQGSSAAKVSQRASVPAAPATGVTAPPKAVERPAVPAAIVPAASPLGKANIPLARKLPSKEMPGAIPSSKSSAPPGALVVPVAGGPATKEQPGRPRSTSPALVTHAPSVPASSASLAAAPPRQQEPLPGADLIDIKALTEPVAAAAPTVTRGNPSAGATAVVSSLGSFDENEHWATSSHGSSYGSTHGSSYGKSSPPQILGAEEGKGDEWGLGVKLPAEERPVRGKLILVSVIAVLIVACGAGAFLYRRQSLNTAAARESPVTQTREQPNPVAQPQIATNPGAEALQAPVQEPVQAPVGAPSSQPSGQPSNSPSNQRSDPLLSKQMPPAIKEGIAGPPKTKAPVAAQPAPAPKPSFKLIPSAAAPKRAAVSRETPQLPALAEEVGSSPNGETSTANGMMTDALRGDAAVPPPPAEAQEKVGGDVKLPRLLHMVPPSYPASAKQINLQGEVTVQATIDAAGKVTDAKVVSGPPLLQGAAMDAVRHWKYEPATLDGKPVPMQVVVKVKFRLN